ncbi:hypothetical protein LTR36_001769 [Oleoguttula mirabilis]|uniref:Chromo domain-containing protein n=1 Tax=Oleoguttula mirabilis TaxID=1507867 RepID=A0AAV9JMG5_9PEZI|nr:hypothetical protein LTR36_001769 [Oleoguttula mirabilis]
MPSLAHVSIPVFSPSPSSGESVIDKGKTPARLQHKARTYSKDPLPVKPSDNAPRNARIVGREMNYHGAFYQLKIGEVELNEVGIDEILDYVSAQHLEEYENRQFEEEAELLRITEVEQDSQDLEDERKELERQQRRKEKALRKGTVAYQDTDDADAGATNGAGAAEIATGKHGRARPNYKPLFKQMKERRRRKRDPATGELMPLTDDDEEPAAVQSSEDEPQQPVSADRFRAVSEVQPKRQRRKRDPVTGELIAIEPAPRTIGADKKRRNRRKRHPLTGELMPLGWRYDQNAPSGSRASGGRHDVGVMSPAMKRLSISQEHTAQRVKLGHQSLSAESSSAAQGQQEDAGSTSDSEQSSAENAEVTIYKAVTKPLPTSSRGRLGVAAMLQLTGTSSVPESSPEPNTMISMVQPDARQVTNDTDSLNDDDELQEGEWIIEAVLAHHMSDPRTHAPELGKKPVMLYHVKWENFDEPSWEPIESFPDRSVVEAYQRRLDQNSAASKTKAEPVKHRVADVRVVQPTSISSVARQSSARTREAEPDDDTEDDGDEEEEGTYVVERIAAHRMSNPSTHGLDFGKQPVLLYQVKWKGYEGLTWEPMDSFEDRKVVHRYRQKVGLPDIEGEDEDEDEDMD